MQFLVSTQPEYYQTNDKLNGTGTFLECYVHRTIFERRINLMELNYMIY